MEIRTQSLNQSAETPRTTHYALRTTHYVSWLLALGLLLAGCGGAFAPWVWRESVALQLTAPGLAEFVKFLAEVRTAQLTIERLHFLYPLFWAILASPLLAENSQLALPRWLRWGLRLAVLPLALAALSPVWTPAILLAPEFLAQTVLAVTAIGLAVIAPVFRRVPLKVLSALLVVSGLIALGLAWQAFGLAQAPLAATYNAPVEFGWGWWLTAIGVGISGGSSLWLAFFGRRGGTDA